MRHRSTSGSGSTTSSAMMPACMQRAFCLTTPKEAEVGLHTAGVLNKSPGHTQHR